MKTPGTVIPDKLSSREKREDHHLLLLISKTSISPTWGACLKP